MSSSESIARGDASAKPTRWSPGNVSKNQLYESSKCLSNPSRGFVQSGEKFACIHEGNTEAAPKSFRKFLVERVFLNALGGIRLGLSRSPIVFGGADPPCPGLLPGVKKSM